MKFDTTAVTALAQQMGQPLSSVADRLTSAMTDAYARTRDAVPGGVAVLDVEGGELTIVDPEGADVTPAGFDRTAATTARQALQMWIKDLERIKKVGAWAHREGTLVRGTVRAHAARNARGEVLVDVGDGVEVVLPSGEQTPGETLSHGQEVVAYVVAVNPTDRGGIRVTVSRRQPDLVTRLFHEVTPELVAGSVQVVAIARDPGSRVKVAVRSTEAGVDPRAALIGAGATRISRVARELRAEKIDVVVASADPLEFVAAALTPAAVRSVRMVDQTRRRVEVGVAPDQVALAAGRGGANTRLAQRLTGLRIEIVAG